jgi:UDP-GlcNAc:undecaprenyl-phosphate GlcNAc-1-phosphate transferase
MATLNGISFTWQMAAVFATALAASLLLTPLAARWSRAVGLVDRPRQGEVQRRAIPRAGGHSLYLSFALAVGLSLLLAPRQPAETQRILGLLAGVAILVPWGPCRSCSPTCLSRPCRCCSASC